jgi:hypothetical protein
VLTHQLHLRLLLLLLALLGRRLLLLLLVIGGLLGVLPWCTAVMIC